MKVLVAGIGNIFFGDDGFGVEVARRLLERRWPPDVRVGEYGIRGVHLAYELLDGYELLVLVDAVPIGRPAGTVALVEIEPDGSADDGGGVIDAHTMTPATVLATLAGLGGRVERVLLVGCQPASLDEGIGLSPAVAAAVDAAIDEVVALVSSATSGAAGTTPAGAAARSEGVVRSGGTIRCDDTMEAVASIATLGKEP